MAETRKWNIFLRFPYEEKYRKEVEQNIANESYQIEMGLGIAVMVMQAAMLILFIIRSNVLDFSVRRMAYICLYTLLFLAAFGAVILRKRWHKTGDQRQYKISMYFSVAACVWTCGITLLDRLGGGELVVFSYMLPAVAALSSLTFIQSAIIFGLTCVAVNIGIAFIPGYSVEMFSYIVNTVSITLLSVMISTRLYSARLSESYSNMVIREQVEEIRKTNELLNYMAVTDQLTGIHNRHYLEKIVQARWSTLSGENAYVAGMMVDIDYFKIYNDRYGHQQGDCCLKRIANEILDFEKSKDIYAVRFGGEEFFICLVGCKEEQAFKAAEELRLRVERGCEDGVTVSIGVSVLKPWEEKNLETLVYETDLALYQAKEQGRNRVVAFTKEMLSAKQEPSYGCINSPGQEQPLG